MTKEKSAFKKADFLSVAIAKAEIIMYNMYKYTFWRFSMRVAVIPNPNKDEGLVQTARLCEILKSRGIDAVTDEDRLYEGTDVVIVLGGDGTILCAAEECATRGIPVMGINLGRVGFMTETEQENMEEAVDSLLSGKYIIEERMMMNVSVGKKDYLALNDCVVAKPDAQMIKTAVFAESEQI